MSAPKESYEDVATVAMMELRIRELKSAGWKIESTMTIEDGTIRDQAWFAMRGPAIRITYSIAPVTPTPPRAKDPPP